MRLVRQQKNTTMFTLESDEIEKIVVKYLEKKYPDLNGALVSVSFEGRGDDIEINVVATNMIQQTPTEEVEV